MRRSCVRSALLVLGLTPGALPPARGADRSEFRGPDRTGASSAKNVPTTRDARTNVEWTIPFSGPGTATPVPFGQRSSVTSSNGYGPDPKTPGDQKKSKRHLVCLNRADGKVVWDTEVPTENYEPEPSGFAALRGQRYRDVSCRHPVEKPRWHALWLLPRTDHPSAPAQVADMVGLSAVTVQAVLHCWNDHGPAGMAERRKDYGSAPRPTARWRNALYAALQKRASDGGVWTGPPSARYVKGWWWAGRPSCGRTEYEWLYVYGFVRPKTGETFTVILSRVNGERMGEALAAFAAGADPDGQKVLVVDNAGWHTAKRLAIPVTFGFSSCRPAPPGVAVRRAVLGAGAGGGGQRHVRPAGRRPGDRLGAIGFHWAIRPEA